MVGGPSCSRAPWTAESRQANVVLNYLSDNFTFPVKCRRLISIIAYKHLEEKRCNSCKRYFLKVFAARTLV